MASAPRAASWRPPATSRPTRFPQPARDAVDRGVLTVDAEGRDCEFRHALLRDAVLGDLVPDELVAIHRTLANELTNDAAAALGLDRAAELARHWDCAEEATPALHWSVVAASEAADRYTFETACTHYERALLWWPAVDDPEAAAGASPLEVLWHAADAAGDAGHFATAAEWTLDALAAADSASTADRVECVQPRPSTHVGGAAGECDVGIRGRDHGARRPS